MSLRVAMCGGGSGGHLYPVLAVATALSHAQPEVPPPGPRRSTPSSQDGDSAHGPGAKAAPHLAPSVRLWHPGRRNPTAPDETPAVLVFAGRTPIDRAVMTGTHWPVVWLDVGPLRGAKPGRLVRNALRMLRAVITCYRRLRTFRAHAALVTGGYASVPVVLAARLAGIPVVLHLPDRTPGWAARWIALLAAHVTLAFDLGGRLHTGAPTTVTGYPLRPEFEQPSAERGCTQFDLALHEPLVLVMGGSQGAQRLNRAVCGTLEALLARTQIVHLCGLLDEAEMRELRAALPPQLRCRYIVRAHLHTGIADSIAAADLVVCRAGAATLAELPATGTPAVLVPADYAGGHQQPNAAFLAHHGAAVVVADTELTGQRLLAEVTALLDDPDRRRRMAAAMRGLAKPAAAARIAVVLRAVARRDRTS